MPTITIHVTDEMSDELNRLFAGLGMTTEDAVKLFFKETLSRHGLPFPMGRELADLAEAKRELKVMPESVQVSEEKER